MIKTNNPVDDLLLKRTETLENGHIELKKAITDNSNLTNAGFDKVNKRLDELKGVLELYESTRFGAKFLAWIGGAGIAIGTIWILVRDVLSK